MVTLDANPMHAVPSQYSGIECTKGIGFALVITVLASIETQDYTHVFSVAVQNVLQPM